MLFLISVKMRNQHDTDYMKPATHIPLRFSEERATFTLRIQKKALQPTLYPFSSKKLHSRDAKHEPNRGVHF
jgi:hypothetical protein